MKEFDRFFLEEIREAGSGQLWTDNTIRRFLSIIDGLEAELEQFHSVDIVPKARLREAEKQRDAALADAGRLAEALKESSDECFRCDQQDEQIDGSYIDKAWAALKAHESQRGDNKT